MNKIKTVFFGSGEFAVPILRKLIDLDYINLEAVVTQPDKPVGRKQVLTPTPVGLEATRLESRVTDQFDLLKPDKLKLFSDEILEKYQHELIIVASYGQIIPSKLINFPKYKALNFHGSLLPKLRGAVPVPMAILQGFEETGVTLQIMAEGMDEGDIVSAERYEIKSDETAESLMATLAELSVKMLDRDLIKWLNGEIIPQKQDESSATYCYKSDLTKDKSEITFGTSVEQADRMVRAFYPWPIAWIKLRVKSDELRVLKIYKARIAKNEEGLESDGSRDSSHGSLEIFRKDKRLFLKLKDDYLELLEIQLEGKKRGEAKDYLFLAD